MRGISMIERALAVTGTFVAVALASASAAAQAEAQPSTSSRTSTRSERFEERWYGWQTLTADGAADALLFTGLATNAQGPVTTWFIAFPLASPVVHALHRQPLEAGVGFGMRVGFPILGGLLGNLGEDPFDKCTPSEPAIPGGTPPRATLCPSRPFLIGAAIGGLLATGIDAGFMSYDEVPRSTTESARAFELHLVPELAVSKNVLSLGVSGTL